MGTDLMDELDSELEAADAHSAGNAFPVAGDVQSIADGLKAQRKKVEVERQPLYLDVPGYDGKLVAKYGAVDWKLLERIGEKVNRSKDNLKLLKGHAATIAAACVELYARAPEGVGVFVEEADQWLIPFCDVIGYDQPVRYDNKLGEFYGFKADNGVEAVMNCIAPRGSERDYIVTLHHNEIMEWMGDAKQEDDDDFLG